MTAMDISVEGHNNLPVFPAHVLSVLQCRGATEAHMKNASSQKEEELTPFSCHELHVLW